MFCVKCGKEDETYDGLCIDCFLNGKELIALPHHVDLERCASCEEFRISGHWFKKPLRTATEDAALSGLGAVDGLRIISAGALPEAQDDRNFLVKVDVQGELCGRVVTAVAETNVRIKNSVCQKCSRQLGNYYEATIQIRSGTKELSDDVRDATVRYVRDRIENISPTNRHIFLTKVEEVQGGVDMLMSSISTAKSLAKDLSDMYGAEMKETAKLVGIADDGSNMYRVTYLVRMPEYHLNDVVMFDGRPYKLSGISKGNGKLTRLGDFHVMSIRKAQMADMKVHTHHNELMKATVVSRSKNEIQILHPLNYSTIDITVPEDADIGETVDVADIDDTMFYVP
jgi:nonsense-mediated mRNA decay protein 3